MIAEDVKFGFMYPPRPEMAVSPELLDFYQNRGFISQVKKNGTCTEIIVAPNGEQKILHPSLVNLPVERKIDLFTRHGEAHKAWTPDFRSPALRRMQELPNEWYIFVAELLHSKGTGQKDTLYVFDMIVAEKPLVGKTFIQRQDMLFNLWDIHKDERFDYCEVDERLWLSKPIINMKFSHVFHNMLGPEDEGLVLKKPDAPLEICGKQSNNQSWQVKSRRETKNYKH
jgi:hypothetical protein